MTTFVIPVRLPSLTNVRLHWRAVANMKKLQRNATRLAMRGMELPEPPIVVHITRVGPAKLDDDNLQSACKYVRDAIAAIIGVDDGNTWAYQWKYYQRKEGKGIYYVEVQIERLTK